MDDSDDDFCYFGTPLEELDPDNVRATKAPRIEDQVVLDKQGRRRFHGAFTGGFSAGYFNSVGTKEGWTPSTFVSSRAQRAESKQTRPQDFMDDEDLAVHGIAPQAIQATASFDDSEHKKRKRVLDPSGPIPGAPVLEEILRPNKETMGMRLLHKLGWKPGQGIGPRVKLSQKKLAKKEAKKIYGCQLPQDQNSDSDEYLGEKDCDADVTFAPDDVETLYLNNPKSDTFGLGYKPLDRTPVLGGHINLFDPSPLVMTEKKKKLLIKGQAFGVGAFEDEDEDIYATEDMSNYDFGEEKSTSKTTAKKTKSHMELMGLVEVIDGFHLSNKGNFAQKKYPLPILPKDFSPYHKPRIRRFQLKENEVQGLGRHDITSEQRARMISDKSQTIVEVRSGTKGKASESSGETPMDTTEVDKLFEEFQSLEGTSRTDYKPFARDETKQKRYELYLKMKDRGQKDRYYLAQPRSMTEWEREREVQEFDRASKLFRPLTSTMATRFVTAVLDDTGPNLKDGLNIEVPKAEEPGASEIDALGQDVSDDRKKAAKMSMFGKLTQTTEDWYPDRLLCRRFNVPDPFPDSNFVGVRKTKREKFSIFSMLDAPPKVSKIHRRDSPPRDLSLSPERHEEGNAEEEPENYGLKVPVDGPPTMDLFKAIFQDSDSDDDKEERLNTKSREPNVDNGSCTSEGNYSQTGIESRSNNESPEAAKNVNTSNNKNEFNMKSSVDSFLSNMRRGNMSDSDSDGEPAFKSNHPIFKVYPLPNEPYQQKSRVSRFEPKTNSCTGETESLPKPIFMPRKKPNVPSEAVSAKGIFANIDFDLLNSYRTAETKSEDGYECNKEDGNANRSNVPSKKDSDTSLDSDDEYGPAVPVHLKNRQQMIKLASSSYTPQPIAKQESRSLQETKWVVKDEKRKEKKQHSHEDKSKRKKEKKKKKHKERKHKKKSSKKHRRKSSSDSSTDSSD